MPPKYDKETLMQMRFIEIEKRLKRAEENDVSFVDTLNKKVHTRQLETLETRIKTLEDARTRQIKLNENL